MTSTLKKTALGLAAVLTLGACQTTGSANLKSGEVLGTDIGSILLDEANVDVSRADEMKMNDEIEKALYFSASGLTTRWYSGLNARMRPTGTVRDRRDRDCRRFRHGVMVGGDWYNGTAVACREYNVAWYLIANRWDRSNAPTIDDDRRERDDRRWRRSDPQPGQRGNWENLSDELGGNPSDNSFDDFGPRGNGW